MRMGVVPGCGLYITMGSYRSGVGQRDFAENEYVLSSGLSPEGESVQGRGW